MRDVKRYLMRIQILLSSKLETFRHGRGFVEH